MRVRAILREASRNVLSGTTRPVVLALALTMLVVLAVTVEVLTVTRLQDEATTFQRSGGSVLTLDAPGRIDGERCEALAALPGVRAAGALTVHADRRTTPVTLPAAPLDAASATAGPWEVLRAEVDHGPGLVLPRETATTLGLRTGDALMTTDGATRVAGLYDFPRDGRRNGLGYLALSATRPDDVFDACWADVWPQDDEVSALLYTTLDVDGGALDEIAPTLGQLNPTHGTEFDGDEQYHARTSRFAAPVVGVLAGVVLLIGIRMRRVELAAALHDGVHRRDLWSIVLVESVVYLVPPVLVGLALGVLVLGAHGEPHVALVLSARIVLTVALGALAGMLTALVLTREKDLFAYSKDR